MLKRECPFFLFKTYLSLKFEKIIDGMKCHTIEEIEDALKSAGFSKVKSDHHKSKPWITVIARKGSSVDNAIQDHGSPTDIIRISFLQGDYSES